ncbi:MAG: gamma-glutamyl-gamma-aminobutyrate hydrolase family protein, partial [Eubacteriales bacterium]|nr:gamma-glutamyl-gamma-aminobutyrate hydrolase family protein [Eubacteriales bacterium]
MNIKDFSLEQLKALKEQLYEEYEKYLGEKIHEKANGICEKRDEFEVNLLKEAYFSNIPTLGICRGAQIMNVAFGGGINQHIEAHLQKEARDLATQKVFIKKDSELYKIIGKEEI